MGFMFLTNITSENLIFDYVLTADPNITKIGFFYNRINGKYIPLDQTDLNHLSNYQTVGTLDQDTGSLVKYYESPNFLLAKITKEVPQIWIGARTMNQQIIDKWMNYSQRPLDSPTVIWRHIIKECFDKNNDIDLFQYSALVPSTRSDTFLYTFAWKFKNTTYCYQSTYSLTFETITCQGYIVDCQPPF